MKHENDLSNMLGWLLPSCENLQFHKQKILHIRSSYIDFLFVKSENNNFKKKEIKHVLRAINSQPGENLGRDCENSGADENPRLYGSGFH